MDNRAQTENKGDEAGDQRPDIDVGLHSHHLISAPRQPWHEAEGQRPPGSE